MDEYFRGFNSLKILEDNFKRNGLFKSVKDQKDIKENKNLRINMSRLRSMRTETFICLTFNRCSINMCGMNEWVYILDLP